MSLVGPRPPLPREVARLRHLAPPAPVDEARASPGCGRSPRDASRTSTAGSRLDLDYIDHWSLWLDLKIIVRTIPASWAGEGR